MLSEKVTDEATARGEEMFRTLPRAIAVRYNTASHHVEVDLSWGYSIHFPPERAQELQHATPVQLEGVEVAGVGFGIYFPQLDVDLWVPSLASGRFGNDTWEEGWAEMHRTPARQQAA